MKRYLVVIIVLYWIKSTKEKKKSRIQSIVTLTQSLSPRIWFWVCEKCVLQALYSRATGAFKGVAGMAFMMWMSGSQIHLFSIMMTFQGIYAPIAAILGSGEGTHPRASPFMLSRSMNKKYEGDTKLPSMALNVLKVSSLGWSPGSIMLDDRIPLLKASTAS